jgi:hypothetical protein
MASQSPGDDWSPMPIFDQRIEDAEIRHVQTVALVVNLVLPSTVESHDFV